MYINVTSTTKLTTITATHTLVDVALLSIADNI